MLQQEAERQTENRKHRVNISLVTLPLPLINYFYGIFGEKIVFFAGLCHYAIKYGKLLADAVKRMYAGILILIMTLYKLFRYTYLP